jgi:RNA polymerase sigma factor (sigma-70 family)
LGGAVVTDVGRTVEAVWKLESGRVVGGLTRIVGDVGVAQELAQDALVAALEQWPREGVPDNPGAWLTTVAKRRAIDHLRRSQRLDPLDGDLAEEGDQPDPEPDDALRLMFLSCHPTLPTPARAALTLRLLGGLTAAEIGRAFLVGETVIARRIAAAKRALADEAVAFELPQGEQLAARLSSVLEVLYLIFNEGYSATAGDDLIRPGLCHEALRLGRQLALLAPRVAEVHGLVALMEIQASRTAARTGPSGEPVPLRDQNRGRWDRLLIERGFAALLRAREIGGPPGPYVLQAAIAASHAQARTAPDTDWAQIAALYDALARLLPTPVVALNRAVAIGMAHGPQAGLTLVDALVEEPTLQDYHLLASVRGDMLLRVGEREQARREFERAAALTDNSAEQAFLLRRAAEIPAATAGVDFGGAAGEFLDGLDPVTARSYGQTLRRLGRSLGEHSTLDDVTCEQVERAFATAWGRAAPATWNRHRSAVRSFAAWAARDDLAAAITPRRITRTPTGPIDPRLLADLFADQGVPLRERVLWQMLHESGAAVTAVLALDVERLDLADRRAPAGRRWVGWRAGTARLLPDLLAGRTRGPLFLAERRPGPSRMPSAADRCPQTGRGRLSYPRAEYLFKQATKPLDPAGIGFTLRRLRMLSR